ncbi:MAG TPA: hypothetical protein VEI01_09935 [Terriglobales bacterium]|nr:hypothetical protein [Terriglobales bacterium]
MDLGTTMEGVPAASVCRKLLLGLVAGAVSYLLLLWLHGPWEEIVAATLIGSVVGIADLSAARILVGSTACAVGWLLGSMLFGVWIELGVGAWLVAGAFLGAAFGAYRRWWMTILAALLGLLAGLLAEASRYLPLLVSALRGLDMQLLLLLSAGLLLNLVAALIAPPCRRAHAGP